MKLYLIAIIYFAAFSLVNFFLYYKDKKSAQKGKWRIPEKTLLLCSALGGAIGGYAAMQIFRHKTKKEHWYFTAVNLVGFIVHIAVVIILAIYT